MTTNNIRPQFIPRFQLPNPALRQAHELQIWPACFEAVAAGTKPFDVREKDLNFQVGDVLLLREYDPDANDYTGRTMQRWVSYVLEGGAFGVQPGWCVLGFSDLPPVPAALTDVRLW